MSSPAQVGASRVHGVHWRRWCLVLVLLASGAAGACGADSIEDQCGRLAKQDRDRGGDYQATYDICIQSHTQSGNGS